jgi:hypothetical protein
LYYIIYRTTNNVNGKFYCGKHQTQDLDDGYLGSGKLLQRAIKKHGRENFTREIVMLCRSVDIMNEMEEYLSIKENWVGNAQCYNMRHGGDGGFDHVHRDPALLEKRKKNSAAAAARRPYLDTTVYWTEDIRRETIERARRNGVASKGSKRSDEFKQYLSGLGAGSNNSQYGTCWCVRNDAVDLSSRQKFRKDAIPDGWMLCREWKERANSRYNASKYYWINDGNTNKYHLKIEPTPTGWVRGRLKAFDKHK